MTDEMFEVRVSVALLKRVLILFLICGAHFQIDGWNFHLTTHYTYHHSVILLNYLPTN